MMHGKQIHLGIDKVFCFLFLETIQTLYYTNSVHVSWSAYFSNLENGVDSESSFVGLPSVVGSVGSKISPATNNIAAASSSTAMTSDSLGLSYLIRAYQTRGHGPVFMKSLRL